MQMPCFLHCERYKIKEMDMVHYDSHFNVYALQRNGSSKYLLVSTVCYEQGFAEMVREDPRELQQLLL